MSEKNNISLHKSSVTSNLVALNTSPTEVAVLSLPSMEEMRTLLLDHEAALIDEAWTVDFLQPRGEDGLEAFATNTGGSLRWFSHSAVATALGSTKIQRLAEDVAALSLDQQKDLLAKLRPSSRADAWRVLTAAAMTQVFADSLTKELEKFADVEVFIRWLQEIASVGTEASARAGVTERATEVLLMMRKRGFLLLPLHFRKWKSSKRWNAAHKVSFTGPLGPLMTEVENLISTGHYSSATAFAKACVLMTSIESFDDFSASLVDEIEEMLTPLAERPAHAVKIARALREAYNNRHPGAPLVPGTTVARRKPAELLRTSGDFGWVAANDDRLSAWQAPLSAFVEQRQTQTKSAVIADLNIFLDFLLQHPEPPLKPELTDRARHIRDVTFRNPDTFMKHVEDYDVNGKRRNRIFGYVREFFSQYGDWLLGQGRKAEAEAFKNPVSPQDRFADGSNPGQTYRTALPSWLLRELRKTLTDNNFEFPRSNKNTDWYKVRDNETGKIEAQWWPGTATILAFILDLPVRSHQARWLDSGELDEEIVDLEKPSTRQNPNPMAIRGRREGCLRVLNDTLRQESWLACFINTNKTSLYSGERRGYEIPFIPPATAELLDNMRKWNARFLRPLIDVVRYNDTSGERVRYAKVDESLLPKVAPLFRDPGSPQMNLPPAYERVTNLYIRVLQETEKRILERRGVKIELTEKRASGDTVWKYDLHTLRVSGITALIESGVSLDVVSELVGHMTVVMTVHYLKRSPGKLRELVAEAHDRAVAEGDFVGSNEFELNLETFSPFLLSKNDKERMGDGGVDVAYGALKQHTGLWSVGSDGICPGTSCSSGGEQQEKGDYGPVPGGKRCGLCRYWITGPAFLLGQMAEANNLIYVVRKKGLQLKEARDQLIDYEEDGKLGLARQLRSRIELLERELEIDLAEWQARYAYAMKSSALLEEYTRTRASVASSNVPAPLVTSDTETGLRLTLEETDEFVLLDHITQMANLLPGFKNREATLEKHSILSKVLADNGLPPLLFTLQPEQAEVAGNLLSSMLLQYVEAQDRRRLLDGDLKLKDIPALQEPLESLAADVEKITSIQSNARKTIAIKPELPR